MALYYDAAPYLTAPPDAGSLKTQIFSSFKTKSGQASKSRSQPKQIYALVVETARWSSVLARVIERAGLLQLEGKLTPALALLLVHDLLLARRGVAAPNSHPLRLAVERHKARLSAEFVRLRVQRGCGSVEELKQRIEQDDAAVGATNLGHGVTTHRPRWIRINTIKTTFEEEMRVTFAGFKRVNKLEDMLNGREQHSIYVDPNVSNLVAVSPHAEIIKTAAYIEGRVILQDKASCFPAELLFAHSAPLGDLIDACAAPGNKTSHLAALLKHSQVIHGSGHNDQSRKIFAIERDRDRAKTLLMMLDVSGASKSVAVHAGQDFLAIDPLKRPWSNVTAILLDPSCSGSGINGRDDSFTVTLPSEAVSAQSSSHKSKVRKHDAGETQASRVLPLQAPTQKLDTASNLQSRLEALSTFQLRILLHAFSFPKAEVITYSTCSIHAEENEHVVCKALLSDTCRDKGWQILQRHAQISGLRAWHIRGDLAAIHSFVNAHNTTAAAIESDLIADACLRCNKDGPEGTQGFFVAAFIRDNWQSARAVRNHTGEERTSDDDADSASEWTGFAD